MNEAELNAWLRNLVIPTGEFHTVDELTMIDGQYGFHVVADDDSEIWIHAGYTGVIRPVQ